MNRHERKHTNGVINRTAASAGKNFIELILISRSISHPYNLHSSLASMASVSGRRGISDLGIFGWIPLNSHSTFPTDYLYKLDQFLGRLFVGSLYDLARTHNGGLREMLQTIVKGKESGISLEIHGREERGTALEFRLQIINHVMCTRKHSFQPFPCKFPHKSTGLILFHANA